MSTKRPASEKSEYQDIIERAERKAAAGRRLQASYDALLNIADVSAALDALVPLMENFVKERERVGEYGAGATEMIELSQIVRKLTGLVAVLTKAIINREMEGGL